MNNNEPGTERLLFSSQATRSSLSFQQMQEIYQKENDRLAVLETYRKKFAASSLFLVFMSLFILLNACVCFSS